MAKSNIRIKKICEWCGQEFVAQKVTTKYCSHRCANLAYKQAIRAKRIQQEEQRIQIVKSEKPLIDIKDKEYLSIAQATTLLGLSLQAVYKMIYTGRLVAYKLSSRLSFVRQSDIEEMLKRNPYKKRQPKDTLPTIEDSNQATPNVIASSPTAEETISEPSEYEVMRINAIAEKNRAIQIKLEKVLNYTKQTMVAYMSEENLNRLCTYVTKYSTGDIFCKVSPVKVDFQLKSIDIMHFGWNIGMAFGRKRIHSATFIKKVFADALRDLEISTIERKMSHTETDCYFKLNKNICLSLK